MLFCWMQTHAQDSKNGSTMRSVDIGVALTKGRTFYDPTSQSYKIVGAGQYSDLNREDLHFHFRKMGGDFLLTADFSFANDNGLQMKKMGWMVRESLRDDAAHIAAVRQGDGTVYMQRRSIRGAYIRDAEDRIFSPKKGLQTIQIERKGNILSMRAASPGEPLQDVGSMTMEHLPDSVAVGVFFCSQDARLPDSADVWNLRIDKPVPDIYHPNPSVRRKTRQAQPTLGSRLETMDVLDGRRYIVRESKGRFEAPNWMPDGKRLLYNESGYLYTIPVKGGMAERLNTGRADRNNNDHGISFDGKWLAISHHREGLPGGGSTVYVLPVEGGEPRMVNGNTPSYWHGWAPDGKNVVVVGQRNGSSIYNIYKVDVKTGQETDLTGNTKGHVDGCEYSPDGKYIYYNANPTGTMQIWRMKPDGSGKEQVTFDEYNNWFPHLSPDGRWIAFISFPTDIDPDSHPSYKKVMLRLMPASGGAPRVIAHLYGGQGTLNVNSWSPDSRRISFVSNSEANTTVASSMER